MKINIFEEIIKLLLIIFIIIMIISLFFNKEKFTTDAPKTDVPKTDAPKTDAPIIDAPKTDAPIIDAPIIDAPKTDAPKTDAPKTDAPKTDAPKIMPDILENVVVDNLTVIGTIDIFPKGIVSAWAGTTIPEGWVICNGENNTPDLSNKFIFGEGTGKSLTARNYSESGGEETHLLTLNELGNHKHYYDSQKSTAEGLIRIIGDPSRQDGLTNNNRIETTGNTGGDMPHNNMPPYYVLAFIMKT